MKTNLLILFVFAAFLALFHISCATQMTPEERAQISLIETNAGKDLTAAAVGGLSTGTWQGAAAGAAGQFVRNHTAAKNPPAVPVTPK